MWQKNRHGHVIAEGVTLDGDKSVPRTHWWNRRILLKWWWKTVTVLQVSAEDARKGYRIGFLSEEDMDAEVTIQTIHHTRFRVRNGREDCRFFAFREGQEVPLTIVARTKKDDPQYADVPLY